MTSDTREQRLSMWAYHLDCLADLPGRERPEDHCDAGRSMVDWQRRWRERVVAALGPDPDPVEPDLVVEVAPEPGDRGFVRHRLVFACERHLDVSATLLVPEVSDAAGTRFPAVVAVHGHGPEPWMYDHGRRTVAGPTPSEPACAAAMIAQCPPFGEDLARAGFVVLAPDLRGFGERWDGWPEGHRMCDLELAQQVALGRLPLAGNLWDLRCCLDLLANDERVDPDRLGAVGFSYGGTLALFLAALDERVRACVASGAFSDPRAASRVPFDLCGAQVFPGMLRDLDHVQVGAAIAPRALLVENGDADIYWPAAEAIAAADRVEAIYAAEGAAGSFRAEVFPGGHRWYGHAVTGFLARHLGLPP
jgi:dienelactone hydrolase